MTQEEWINEWAYFASNFDKIGINSLYEMNLLEEELKSSPGGLNVDSGLAYPGGLIVHINRSTKIALRLAKMVSGTFTLSDETVIKCCVIMHLQKRFMFEDNDDIWQVKNRGLKYKFRQDITSYLRCGSLSALEALNNGVKLSTDEYEAIMSLDEREENNKNYRKPILYLIIKTANELAYAIERESRN